MSYPWLHQSTWDDGTKQNFNTETDASSILDFPDYRELARFGLTPWQGAHALRLSLNGTATADVTEIDDFDTAAGGTVHLWFTVLIGADLTLSAGDAVTLLSLDSAGPVSEGVFGVRNNGGVYEFFAGETGATRTFPITRSNSTWYQVEISATIGNPANGTLDVFVDGGPMGAQITGLTQAAITQLRLGAISGTAAGNSGTILIGGIIGDDTRVFPRTRFKETVWVTRDMNAIVGPCTLDSVTLTGTSTDATLTILDTDSYNATDPNFSREPVIYVRNVTANDQAPGQNLPVELTHGAYCILTGANPQAWLSMTCPSGAVMSDNHYVSRGLNRRA